ncbi:sperm acrosome membrane-associated protein 4 [Danio aesculapii]|uniref:sperm acrosome membrane-associated protein 4 n=1 Tax=Danio aesculapii TaxID=1142201 RepID=UPI0024BF684F|nr:sperm acrosome membrane-associated protein 4 [Danio aesculapii]
MNKIILASFVLALYFAVGHGLQCYDCKLGFWDFCFTTKKTCDAGQQCFSGLGKAGGLVDIKTKGCLELSKCNKTEATTFPANSSTQIYQMTKTCCATDLCNSGHIHISAVSMAFTTITSVFMAKLLI